ncbi:MAG: amylo-alpha-1,6-glucosidase [Spirochaetota bacterium]|nr:amylo-alpha-1,6-glucosidase [Spirochaetota bacterium]
MISAEKENSISISENKRLLRSDHGTTYFSISDNLNEFDGLWSYGFHLFQRVFINEKERVVGKKISRFQCEMSYHNGSSVRMMLFKNNQGFWFSPYKKAFSHSLINYRFAVTSDFELVNAEKNVIYLKYLTPQRDGFGVDILYVAVTCEQSFSFENVRASQNFLDFKQRKVKGEKKDAGVLFLYSSNFDKLRESVKAKSNYVDVLIKQHINNSMLTLKYSECNTNSTMLNKALNFASISGSYFIMSKNNRIGIWAGFPWFDNGWGRDTFIALPGIALVTGRFEQAAHIISVFLKYQDTNKASATYGRIPNVIWNEENIMFNTADATPLLIRELYEYYLYTGDVATIMSVWNKIILSVDAVYIAHKDKYNFVPNEDADDWMDARILGDDSYSPRGDRQVEIQSLWFTALHAVVQMANELIRRNENYSPLLQDIDIAVVKRKRDEYLNEAEKLSRSFKKMFITSEAPYIYDHLNKDGSADMKARPNVLLAIYYNDLPGIPSLIDRDAGLRAFKYISSNCVFEHGVASLGRYEADFHPVHISKMYHKDAAYHNGMIWCWLSGAFVHVAASYGLEKFAFKHTKILTREIIRGATPGCLPELFDPICKGGKVNASGTYSQAWSVSEYNRAFYQDYMGIRPDVPARKLYFTPHFPAEIGGFQTKVRYGSYETLYIDLKTNLKTGNISAMSIFAQEILQPLEVTVKVNIGTEEIDGKVENKSVYIKIMLKSSAARIKLGFDFVENNRFKLKDLYVSNNAELLSMQTSGETLCEPVTANLTYTQPLSESDICSYRCMMEEDYLDKKIMGSRFDKEKRFE